MHCLALVKHRSTTFQIASLLCLFAFVAMQAFGPGRLYLCLCGEQAVIQSKATCEEVGQTCHAEESEESDSPDAHVMAQVMSAEDWPHHQHHDHFAVRDDLGAHALAKVSAPAIAWIPLVPWLAEAMIELKAPASASFATRGAERAPPPATPLGRSFHLLI
jgi:hypothetical protein